MNDLAIGAFEKVASGIYLEGLAVDYVHDTIWYSDVIAGGIHGVKPDGTKVATFNEGRMWTGGVMLNEDGSVLSTGEGGIMWNNPETGASGWLLDSIDDKPINGINEMVPDGNGGIFFGTNDIEMVIKGNSTRPTELYRLTVDRELFKLVEGIGFTNGIAYDARNRRFYCNDTFHCTWAFDVAEDLTLSNKQVFLVKEDVDGMALDANSNLWVTGFRSNFLTRLRPDGTELPRVGDTRRLDHPGTLRRSRYARFLLQFSSGRWWRHAEGRQRDHQPELFPVSRTLGDSRSANHTSALQTRLTPRQANRRGP